MGEAKKAYEFPKGPRDSSEAAPKVAPIGMEQATVWVSRYQVRSVIVRELKHYGVREAKTMDTLEDCCRDLRERPGSMLVLDWEHGEEKVARVLKAAQGPHRVDTRSIYFLTVDISERVLSVAQEYNVTQIHTGEISQAHIAKNLDEIVRFTLISPACREVFRRVALSRKQRDWRGASEALHDLCEAEPSNLRACVEYGYNLIEEGRLAEAEPWLRQLMQNFPDDLRTRHLLARCLMKLDRLSEAKILLEEASAVSPLHLDRLVEFGHLLVRMNQLDEAMGKFKEALEIEKDLYEAKAGQAEIEMLRGRVNEAVHLLGAVQDPKELASVFNNAAVVAIHNGRFHQGLSLYKSALGFVQSDSQVMARVFFNMGVGLIKWGKPQVAVAAFTEALQHDPTLSKADHNRKLLEHTMRKGGNLSAIKADIIDINDEGPIAEASEADGHGKSAEGKHPAAETEDEDLFFQSLLSKY